MAFTQAVPVGATLNKDSSVSITLVYSGDGEETMKESIVLPAGSVLDEVTLRKEAIRRVSNRNAAAAFESFVKSNLDQPIDLSEPEDTPDEVTLKNFAVLAGRMRDLERSSMRGCASQDDYLAALAAMQEAYANAKGELRAKMDMVT